MIKTSNTYSHAAINSAAIVSRILVSMNFTLCLKFNQLIRCKLFCSDYSIGAKEKMSRIVLHFFALLILHQFVTENSRMLVTENRRMTNAGFKSARGFLLFVSHVSHFLDWILRILFLLVY